ncbi:hypothetical protein [Streptomyces catenulae]|uniref:Uncharacterized protein n=1 Tax=Streptomyces catenulae TaxID=66875 RepID=A0ABV2YTP0_9ACTN|nr:hypothetical protein [Streptomyces catenulae]
MPTAIAVTGSDLALPAADRTTPAAVVLPAPHLQPLDEALTQTAAVLEHHGHLVVLYSDACPADHVRRLHTLRGLLESDRIALVKVDLPPLGLAVLARQLRELSRSALSPGVLACAARLLAHYIHAGALLATVGGLDRVEVDLRAHMASWLPGVQFAVLAAPAPHLVRVERHRTDAALPAPSYATELVLARGHFNGDWVGSVLAPAWQVRGAHEVPLPTESAQWWGTRKLVEFAAAIPDPALLHRLVSSVRREECAWCGLELLGDRCAFCGTPCRGGEHVAAGGRAVTEGTTGTRGAPAALPPGGGEPPAAGAPASAGAPAPLPGTAPGPLPGPLPPGPASAAPPPASAPPDTAPPGEAPPAARPFGTPGVPGAPGAFGAPCVPGLPAGPAPLPPDAPPTGPPYPGVYPGGTPLAGPLPGGPFAGRPPTGPPPAAPPAAGPPYALGLSPVAPPGVPGGVPRPQPPRPAPIEVPHP